MIRFLLILLMIMSGCDSHPPEPKRDNVFVEITLVDRLPPGIQGLATYNLKTGFCKVQVLKSHYPRCLKHEIRHCFEGQWHEGINTTHDC